MPAQGSRHATRGSRHATHAFSLAELMIALVILGLGLLFIAAALPVGLDYTRQTVNQATGEAAGECALSLLELYLRTSGDDLYEPTLAQSPTPVWQRLDNIHRPRNYLHPVGQPPTYPLDEMYEPFFKVRPLVTGNIRFGLLPGAGTRQIVDDVEPAIAAYLSALGITIPAAPLETDSPVTPLADLRLARYPAFPGLARVYAPIEPVTTLSAANFFNNDDAYPMYGMRFSLPDDPDLGTLSQVQQNNECEKGLEHRVAWTAFYRRVSYKFVDPDTPPAFDGDEYPEDPLTYELIIVVTRRTTLNHSFPRQDLVNPSNPFEQPQAWAQNAAPDDALVGADRLAPTPWLVTFDSNASGPALPLLETFGANLYGGQDRTILANTGFSDPATLTFRCTPEVSVLLPVGSVFIPAFNDARYVALASGMDTRQSGFVPHAPEGLPIYEVAERPDATTVVVKNNGYYPWVVTGIPAQTQGWPVWVIPPASAERDASGQPVYERTSPIVAVVRRTVTLREVRP